MSFVPDPNNISIDYGTYTIHVPKSVSTLVQSIPTEIRELDLNQFRLKLKDLEDEIFGMAELRTHRHNTTVSVGGVDLARVIEIINGYTVTFEDGQYAVQLVGANSNVGDVVNVNQVSIRTSNSVGLVTSKAIEFGEYNGYVTIDVLSQYTGTVYPTGTGRQPVNNTPDGVAICVQYGFPEIHVVGDIVLGLGDDVRKLKIVGVSHVNANITVLADALCLETAFDSFDITGVLDGDSEITNCVVHDIEYFNGHIHDSLLSGTIKLRGSEDAHISNCSILDILNPPTIDAGGSGQNLVMPRFSGLLTVTNLTGASHLGIGLDGADITIDATCTSGIIAVSGNGRVTDNSGDGCYVVNTASDGTELANLQTLIETQRPHHIGTGDVYYWNPVNGDDTYDGGHPDRAVKTFAEAHNMATDNNHDIIFCISGDPSGITIANENIVFTKNYLFLRGPGRDFTIHSIDDTKPAIDIQSNGVEVSGMIASTELTNTTSTIKSSGGFPLIKNIFLENSVNAIDIVGGTNGIIDSCRIGHNSGYGIKVSGNSSHFQIKYSHIGSNGNNGIIVDCTTGHELEIDYTTIHGNTGYGVDVVNGDDIIIKQDVSIFDNTIDDFNGTGIVDLRIDLTGVTATLSPTDITNITDSVLSTDIAPYEDGLGLGGNVFHLKHLEYKIFIDTVDGLLDGDGSQHKPFDNEIDGIDYAESHGLRDLILYNEITLYKQIKNFVVRGVGRPKVNLNNQDIKNSEFIHCELTGIYLDRIVAEDCHLTGNGTYLNGWFTNCALSSAFIIPDGGSAFIDNTKPYVVGFVKPSFDIGGLTGTAQLNVMSYEGGVTILNCNQITDDVKIIIHGGIIELDSSCTAGSIRIFGEGTLINNSSLIVGSELINNLVQPQTISQIDSNVTIIDSKVDDLPLDVWNLDKDTVFTANSMGEWVVKKLLSIKTYLGLG